MGFERYWEIEFHTHDVKRGNFGGSGLRSVVMWDPSSGLKFANNEPAPPFFKASQIYLFYLDHRGAGVQHVALAVSDLLTAVEGMCARGVQFMPTPSAYYEMLRNVCSSSASTASKRSWTGCRSSRCSSTESATASTCSRSS